MKKLLLILFAFALSGGMAWGQANVIISEVTDNATYSAEFVELYNAGNVSQDLLNWKLQQYGSTQSTLFDASITTNMTGNYTLNPGEYVVVCRGTLADLQSAYPSFNGSYFTTGNASTGAPQMNGGEYFELVDASGAVVDYMGSSSSTTTSSKTYERKDALSSGNNIGTDWVELANTEGTPGAANATALANDNSSSGNDQTTEVYEPSPQIAAGTISSLNDTKADSVNVFKMTIEDQASGDGLPTHVTNIRVTPYSTNTADWTNTIQGVTLYDGAAVTTGTPVITDTYIDIPISSGDLDIADGGSKDVTIAVYLNTTAIEDGSILSFMVDGANHGFTADASGSDFISSFTLGSFNSNDFTVSVVATKLQFRDEPTSVTTNTDFTLTVDAVDANGNTDYDDATSVALSVKTGTGTLSSATGLTQSLSSGTYSWNDLQYNTAENFTIAANGGSYTEIVTGTITASEPAKLIISEVADPSDEYNGRFVELYNAGSNDIDFGSETWYLCGQANGGSTWSDIQLTGKVKAGGTYVTSYSLSSFNTDYGFDSDQNTGINGSGDDGYFLYKGGDHTSGTLVDAYGVINEDGTGKTWEYTDSHAVRNSSVSNANTTWTSSEWTITGAAVSDMTPGTHGDCITFNGSSTSVWGTAANWVGGAIPTSSKNAKIPSGLTNNPSVDGDATTPSQCNNLKVSSGGTLTIPSGKALTVNSNLANNSTASGLIVSSNSSGNGSLIVMGTETGDVTIQRYFGAYTAAGDGWYEIGSPVDGMTIAGSDFEPGTTSPDIDDLYAWDESTNTWLNYKDASPFTTFTQGQGYLAAYETAQTNSFTGELLTGDLGITSLYYTSGASHQGWNLLGNPYSSAIEWNNGGWTFTNVGTVCSVWDESAGNYVNPANGDPIPSTNGFFVQATASSNEITIPASARVHNGTNNYKSSQVSDDPNTLIIKVTTDVTSFNNITKVAFKADATEAWDIQYDAHKLFGAETAPQLWTISQNDEFSLNTLPFTQEPVDLPMNFKAGIDGQYQITLEGIDNFSNEADVVLEDLFTGQSIDVRNNQTYTFTATKEDETNRFVLHFYNVTSTPELETIDSKAFIYTTNNSSIIVKAMDKELNGTIEVLNILGQTMDVNKVSHATFVKLSTHYNSGVYFVRYTEPDGYTQTRKVVLN